jgi:hypothetical protein
LAIEFVDPSTSAERFALFNDQNSPFQNLDATLSFAPTGGTIVFVKGTFPGPRLLDRPSTLRALTPVTLGR